MKKFAKLITIIAVFILAVVYIQVGSAKVKEPQYSADPPAKSTKTSKTKKIKHLVVQLPKHKHKKTTKSAASTKPGETSASAGAAATGYTDQDGVNISWFIDGSYNYLSESNRFTSGVLDRINDIQQNGATLQQSRLTFDKRPDSGFGGLINFIIGRDAFFTQSFGFTPVINHYLGFDLEQYYAQYAQAPWTIQAGHFESLAGYEQIDPTLNVNFSRAIVGYLVPNAHLGVRTTYAVNKNFNLRFGVNNGWDNLRDTSRQKTLEFNIDYTMDPFSFWIACYSGEERIVDFTAEGPVGRRNLFDFIGTYKATEKLNFAVEYDYSMQTNVLLPDETTGQAVAQGIAGYAIYKLNDKWQFCLRAEYFDDSDGFRTGVKQIWKEITFTIGYFPNKHVGIHLEARRDFSNVNSFVDVNGVTTNNNNQSVGLEIYYKF